MTREIWDPDHGRTAQPHLGSHALVWISPRLDLQITQLQNKQLLFYTNLLLTLIGRAGEPEPGVFGSLGAGAVEKKQEPEPEPEPLGKKVRSRSR